MFVLLVGVAQYCGVVSAVVTKLSVPWAWMEPWEEWQQLLAASMLIGGSFLVSWGFTR